RGCVHGTSFTLFRHDGAITIGVVDTGEIVRMPMQRVLLLQPRDVPHDHPVVLEQFGRARAWISRREGRRLNKQYPNPDDPTHAGPLSGLSALFTAGAPRANASRSRRAAGRRCLARSSRP